MDPGRFFASSKMLIVAGKGGVGKTVTAATLATAARRVGVSTLLVEVGGRSGAEPLLGVDTIGYEPVEVPTRTADDAPLHVRSITPDEALVEWLSLHGFRYLVGRMARSGLLEVIATATPGIKDLLVLGKIRNLESSDDADLIVVDAPAAGHALGFLRAPAAIVETARSGTIHRQAVEALALLSDSTRCRVMLVTLPEETPVNELVETAFALEEEVGVALAPVVVNDVLPPLTGVGPELPGTPLLGTIGPDVRNAMEIASRFRAGRLELQEEHLTGLRERLPLPEIRLSHRFGPALDPTEVDALVDELLAGIEHLPEPRTR